MATKYGKYFLKAPIKLDPFIPRGEGIVIPKVMRFPACDYDKMANANWILVPVVKALIMKETAMKHDFPQFLCFIGGDPYDIGEYGAEVEAYLGEEGEKHVITSPTILYLPPNMIHGPFVYRKVTKPVLHLDVFFAKEYKAQDVTRAKEVIIKPLSS